MKVFDGAKMDAAELLVNCEVDVVLLYLVAQLVHVEKAHVPSVEATEILDAVCGEIAGQSRDSTG